MSAFEMKTCPLCRGSGQYCTTYPKYFSPCGECHGTGKVRTYVELLRDAAKPRAGDDPR